MIVHDKLKTMFTFADPTLSCLTVSDVENFLYNKRNGNVYLAAFRRDLEKIVTIPAFKLLAEDLVTYLSSPAILTQAEFDTWHHDTCERFLAVLNSGLAHPKKYGKAQKALNMAMKYAYCCNDAPLSKFTYAHMALDGYTYFETDIVSYPLSFCRDKVFPWKHGRKPRGRSSFWRSLEYRAYSDTIEDIRDLVAKHPHTFNEYLSACHTVGLFTAVTPVAPEDDRELLLIEAEFFIWEICKNGRLAALTALF